MRGRCRTAGGRRTKAWRGRPARAVRRGAATLALGLSIAGVPGQAMALPALPAAAAAPGSYGFAEAATGIEGARSTADAEPLAPGRSYRSSLPSSARVSYRLDLDATTNAYVSVTAVPPPGSSVSVVDGLKVSVQDAEGNSCSVDTTTFGAARSPHPLAAWGMREISPGKSLCREAGAYYVSVERADPKGEGSSPDTWQLELLAVTEPRTAKAGATGAPQAWDSATPEPLRGDAEQRDGGAGFAGATPLDQGVWREELRPGQTVFYAVPVDWGQQLSVTADLGGSGSGGTGYASDALEVTLYNPARGHVARLGVGYDGDRKSGSLPPLPPVDHANRNSPLAQTGALRFAGSYYLVAHLSESVADSFGDGPFPMTLRVKVSGTAQAGPDYAGTSDPAGLFDVSEEDREAADGVPGGDDTALRLVAVSGIGTGSALLVGLGVWTLLARRRSAAPR
ncbi:hypothetical protein ACH4C6_15910 [Streptomyces sp. NPDC017943]|uniref:hypothetical protein n=1 Tax=Streptomyces sp. NPDC017943 TaxID=3365019 RepID=UPI0037A6429A